MKQTPQSPDLTVSQLAAGLVGAKADIVGNLKAFGFSIDENAVIPKRVIDMVFDDGSLVRVDTPQDAERIFPKDHWSFIQWYASFDDESDPKSVFECCGFFVADIVMTVDENGHEKHTEGAHAISLFVHLASHGALALFPFQLRRVVGANKARVLYTICDNYFWPWEP